MRIDSPFRAIACLLACAVLGGCFATGSSEWGKAGVDSQVAARDLGVCQRESRLVTREEGKIDQDIVASRGSDWQTTGSYASNVAQMRDSGAARQREMIARCMKTKGYSQGAAK